MKSKEAQRLLRIDQAYWFDIYKAAEDDLRFSIGEQHWSEADIKARDGRPCLVINQLPQFIHQTANDMRQKTPSINVIPGDSEADIETAKVIKGMTRYIEYKSGADAAYDTAGEYAVRCSIGFIGVDHDYVSCDSFDQELKIKRIQNPLAWWIDSNSVEPDGSDSNRAIGLESISKEDFEERYPGRAFIDFQMGEKAKDKQSENTITIAEVYIKEYETLTKQLNEDTGETEDYVEDEDPDVEKKKKKRTLRKVKIKRYRFSGEEEPLEETTFPGIYIPVVPVYGEEVWVNGERNILSLIRQSKDAQRRLNHWASKESEILNMAPTAPVMAPVGATDDFDEWEDPGNAIVLRYRMQDDTGQPLEKPERLQPPSIPTGIINAMQGAKENIKETMGLYNSSLGQKSNEISGVAIQQRDEQGLTGTLHFSDNQKRSIQHVGRIIVIACPEVYDTPRVIQIVGDEEDMQQVAINGAAWAEDQKQDHFLNKGQYDVRIITGNSYATQREEAAHFMGDLVKAEPKLLGVFGDLLFKNMDVAGAQAVAERLKKTIPPQLLDENNDDPAKQQMTQQIQGLQQQLGQMSQELQSKQADDQAKLQANQIKAQTEANKTQWENAKLQLEALTEKNKNAYEMAKLQLEAEKLEIEKQKVAIEAFNAQKEPPAPASAAPSSPTAIKLDTTGFQMMKTPEQQAKDDTDAETQAQQALMAQQQQAADLQMKAAQTEAVIQALASISQQLNGLTTQVSQPITVIRDETGAIVGAQ